MPMEIVAGATASLTRTLIRLRATEGGRPYEWLAMDFLAGLTKYHDLFPGGVVGVATGAAPATPRNSVSSKG
jgi:hypothetical protein